MNIRKAQKVKLSDHFDESWLQRQIEEDTTILGLGDLIVLRRERRQSSGGRIDFLLHDPETETLYEVELMLGATDESHIIRTIEYWDLEARKNPSKEHRAVIVAEKITSRFFNVIYLLNRAIPVIAIQLDVLKVDDDLVLHFTKILDVYEVAEDAIALGGEPIERSYWEARSNPRSMASADAIINLCKTLCPSLRVTFNKYHIALGTQRQNFCWLYPRKKPDHCYGYLNVGAQNVEQARAVADRAGAFIAREEGDFSFTLSTETINEKRDLVAEIFKIAIAEYS